MRALFATTAALSLAGLALAVPPEIDGLDINSATWNGPSIAVQDTNTQFGNNWNELNQLFVDSDNDNVYIGIPGNLADNNALTMFIDTDAPVGNNPIVTEPGEQVPCVGEYPRLLRYYNGTTFDAGFTPDYALTISVGIFPGQSTAQLVFACDLTDLNTLEVTVLGIGAAGSGNGLLTGDSGVQVALDNSNTGGVGGWFTPGGETPAQTGDDPTDAITGVEIAIPRALIGLDVQTPTEVGFFAYISDNAQGGDSFPGICGKRGWGSNQGLPGLAGWGNLNEFNGVLPPDPNSKLLDFSANPPPNIATKTIPGIPP